MTKKILPDVLRALEVMKVTDSKLEAFKSHIKKRTEKDFFFFFAGKENTSCFMIKGTCCCVLTDLRLKPKEQLNISENI